MTFDERAATMTREEVAELLASHEQLTASLDELRRQVEWFKRQLFGSKSDRRVVVPDGRQLFLGEAGNEIPAVADSSVTVAEHQRRRRPPQEEADESGLRFDESVPVEEIRLEDPDLQAGEGEVVTEKVTYRLAQRPASYVVLKYVRPVVKRRDGGLSCPPAPPSVLGKSLADVSLLACLAGDRQVPVPPAALPQAPEDAGRRRAAREHLRPATPAPRAGSAPRPPPATV